ncbi:MAG TPA: DUF1015 domain-containing protein [Propionibacteriaceae bacterium]|nr:DUF1015 domain-containing protein [Propionibacteriaceae bacterium]
MPEFQPFRALRYAAEDLHPLVAPPYDVLSNADVDALQAKSEHNITRIDVPRGGPDRYRRAAGLLQDWRRTGVLVADEEPSYTLYRMRFTDASGTRRDITGVVGGLEITDEGAGGVLPHERTTPKASTDRLDLTRATRANLSPVWGLSLASGLTALLAEPGEPLGAITEDGVEHIVERVTDPDRIAAIQRVLAADDVLIADGHHRYSISRTYRDDVRAASSDHDTPAEQTLAFVNELVADQLSVDAIHRLYAGITLPELTAALARSFTMTELGRPTAETLAAMQREGFLVLVAADDSWRLDPHPGRFDGVRALDGAWLETALADVGLTVTYQHGLAAALAEVDAGRATAAVLIRPVSVAEIERTAREGLLMPPKSTFFTPKLKTGFVIRSLENELSA